MNPEPVRQAVRKAVDPNKRQRATTGIVGIWKNRDDIGGSTEYIRNLRRSTRLERLSE
jgi:hypothetical protein